ncbi:MAG: hypothetical protein CMF55_07230 [Legionellales bacterium]|nr:hypothetical protein [Legionellales bacterium]HAG61964.1 hypothetical protein [Coxiellaceae bacterium]
MHRTASQRRIPTENDDIISPNPKTTEKDSKEQPASWGWFVEGDCTPPTEIFPKPSYRSQASRQHAPIHPHTRTIDQKKATLTTNLSLSEYILLECLLYCHPTLQQSILSMTGISQKLEPPLKETDNKPEPGISIMCRR